MNTVNWLKLGSIYLFVKKKFKALKGMKVLFSIMLKDIHSFIHSLFGNLSVDDIQIKF